MSLFVIRTCVSTFRHCFVCCLLIVSALPLHVWAVDTDGDGLQDRGNYEYDESFETGDFTALPWVLTGTNPGVLSVYDETQLSQRIDGRYMVASPAMSGGFANTKYARMAFTVNVANAGSILFDWKGVCQGLCALNFYIDGVAKVQYLSDSSWNQRSYPVTAGTHAFKWEIASSNTVASGKIRIDNIRIGNPALEDLDDDNDGALDTSDKFPLDSSESVDADNDGIGDNADIDDDNDGVPDYIDSDPFNAAIATENVFPVNSHYQGSVLKEQTLRQ